MTHETFSQTQLSILLILSALVSGVMLACGVSPESGADLASCAQDSDAYCLDDEDCGPGYVCNYELDRQQCVALYCLAGGETCSDDNECATQRCNADAVCLDPLYCDGELVEQTWGGEPRTPEHCGECGWSCLDVMGGIDVIDEDELSCREGRCSGVVSTRVEATCANPDDCGTPIHCSRVCEVYGLECGRGSSIAVAMAPGSPVPGYPVPFLACDDNFWYAVEWEERQYVEGFDVECGCQEPQEDS